MFELRVARSGRPRSSEYPVAWAVYTWLDGTPMLEAQFVDQAVIASGLAEPLAALDEPVRGSIPALAPDGIDVGAVIAAWEQALVVPAWSGRPVWLHGDLMPTNLLVAEDGALAGVLDFGSCTAGDPACESLLAWMTLTSSTRGRHRELVGLDDAAWARARGWALAFAVMAAPYYRLSFPVFASVARQTIAEVLAESRQ